MTTPAFTPRVFSGIKPSGGLTLGNYLGMVKRAVEMQNAGSFETIYCMVDLHAITVWQDPADLRHNTREIAAFLIASGIDPDRSILVNQSQVAEHAQLAWLFNCVARMGWMGRMTQWKDKAGKNSENASLGLFAYPALMAADILLYHATHVPVGDDQKQHLELTRNIAARCNQQFNAPGFFPLPDGLIEGPGARIMSLKDGTKKMSKSDPAENSRINLIDDAATIARKIKKSKTDTLGDMPETVEQLDGRPEVANLVGIYAALAGQSDEQVLTEYGGKGFGTFKPALADLAVAQLSPITQEMRRLLDDPAEIDVALAKGAEKANALAEPIIEEVRRVVGFWQV